MLLLASSASLAASIMAIIKIQVFLKSGWLVGEIKWLLLIIASFFSIMSMLLISKFVSSFSKITVESDEIELNIFGGDIEKSIVWSEVDFISVGREALGKSVVDALVFTQYDGIEFKILDKYSKSPRDLFAILRTFCNQAGIHVTFNSGGPLL
jgi:hypothetical protein